MFVLNVEEPAQQLSDKALQWLQHLEIIEKHAVLAQSRRKRAHSPGAGLRLKGNGEVEVWDKSLEDRDAAALERAKNIIMTAQSLHLKDENSMKDKVVHSGKQVAEESMCLKYKDDGMSGQNVASETAGTVETSWRFHGWQCANNTCFIAVGPNPDDGTYCCRKCHWRSVTGCFSKRGRHAETCGRLQPWSKNRAPDVAPKDPIPIT